MSRILVTGANGFIGRNLCRRLLADGHQLTALSRSGTNIPGAHNLGFDFETSSEFPSLDGIDVLFHLAACVPHNKKKASKPADEIRKINRDLTVFLAESAARSKVGRFIFLSTTSIFGNQSPLNKPFSEEDLASPHDLYTTSKHQAEIALTKLGQLTGLETTIIRAPLVYGPDAPGKFAGLVKLVASGVPLPFAAIHNSRSFVNVDNLVDALVLCATHPIAANKLYIVCDGEDISTPDLIRHISAAFGKRGRLIHVPLGILRFLFMLIGKQKSLDNLASSFQVNSSNIRNELGWTPPINVGEGLNNLKIHSG